jgi:pentalenene oxygenase
MVGVETGARFARAPGLWPLVGHSWPLYRDPLRFLAGLSALGDLVEIGVGPSRMVVVCDPGLTHQVVTDLRTFDRAGVLYDRLRAAMGSGLATAAHAEHRRQRLVMQPAFHPGHLPGYAAVMREETAGLVERWRDGQCVDLVEDMFRLTMSVALRTLFSTHVDPDAAARLRDAFDVFLRGIYSRVTVPGLVRLPFDRRYRTALRQWRTHVRELIAGYRADGGAQDDLMGRLLSAPEPLTDTQLCDQVAGLLLAGAETTSSALCWSVYLLCRHPDVLAEVGRDRELAARVILESMRLYPPVWVILRSATADTRLGGHPLRAGSMVVLSPYVLHRDPGLFAEPERFDPDRWSGVVDRHAYLPFGGGATKCIGERFALTEASIALTSILREWTPSLVDPDTPPTANLRLVLAPRRLPVRLNRRAGESTSRPA